MWLVMNLNDATQKYHIRDKLLLRNNKTQVENNNGDSTGMVPKLRVEIRT